MTEAEVCMRHLKVEEMPPAEGTGSRAGKEGDSLPRPHDDYSSSDIFSFAHFTHFGPRSSKP